MALPKYKTSRANTHSRRANWKALPHMACPSCGSYRGRVSRAAIRSAHTK